MPRKQPVIALADDNPAHLELLHDILTDEGYQALPCWLRPHTCAPLVADHPALHAVDLLIVDLHRERQDSGVRLIEELRQRAPTRDLPILVCSADVRFLRERADPLRQLGCDALEKPFDLDELLATVATLLRPRAARPAAGPLYTGTAE